MMKEKYEEYLKSFGLAYEEPMTYEEFKASEEKRIAEKEAKEARVEEINKSTENPYTKYIEEALKYGEGSDERIKIANKLTENHKAKVDALYKEKKLDEISALNQMKNEAKDKIKPPKKRRRHRVSPVATNVYDDDDNPTSH